jgi:hypothetical protein
MLFTVIAASLMLHAVLAAREGRGVEADIFNIQVGPEVPWAGFLFARLHERSAQLLQRVLYQQNLLQRSIESRVFRTTPAPARII